MPSMSKSLSSNNSFSEILPLDSKDSYRLMVSICIFAIRPLPECLINSLFLFGSIELEPVIMNCPNSFRLSTIALIESHRTEASCHSSIRRGVSPARRSEGFTLMVAWYLSRMSGSCILMVLFACCSAVVVLPHHFGPSISTAPEEASSKLKYSSAVLLRYSILFVV